MKLHTVPILALDGNER